MANVTISDIHDARKAGEKYGVIFPKDKNGVYGRGRPPMKALLTAILAAGDTVVPTEYFDGTWAERAKPAKTGEAEYRVTVNYQKKGTRKDGKAYTTAARDKTFTLNIETIRELAEVAHKSRVSVSAVRSAAEAFLKLTPEDVLAFSAERVEPLQLPTEPVELPTAVESTPAVAEPETATESQDEPASELVEA